MLQPAGDLRFEDESAATPFIVGVSSLNLLERDFAMQLRVFCDEDFPKASLGVRPQDPVTNVWLENVIDRRRRSRGERIRWLTDAEEGRLVATAAPWLRDLILVGPGAVLLGSVAPTARVAPLEAPSAESVARLAAASDPVPPTPLYLRPPDALPKAARAPT